jgi:uncharacterized surface protein with fasciclin (FAS1) repeats
MTKISLGALAVAGAFVLSPVAQAVDAPAYAILSSQPQFATTTTMITITGMVDRANGASPFTMFAPTETAWADRSGVKDTLLRFLQTTGNRGTDVFPDTGRIIRVIRSWTVPGRHPSSEFAGKTVTLTNLNGDSVTVNGTQSGQLGVSFRSTVTHEGLDATCKLPEINATNAVIYACDTVSISQ